VTRAAETATEALALARRRDSTRRRQRVLGALERLSVAGEEISVAGVARAAGVDRSFLYRHHDLRAQILERAAQSQPDASMPRAAQVSRQSLLADLANSRAENERLRRQNSKLARRLSEVLGEEVFRASGLGGPDDTEQLRRRVAELEQTVLDLRQALEERTEELDAARTTNRDLMSEVNRLPGRWPPADKARKRTPRP
jgi:regulator of replication initiation timing